jgi:hypothetical protein
MKLLYVIILSDTYYIQQYLYNTKLKFLFNNVNFEFLMGLKMHK